MLVFLCLGCQIIGPFYPLSAGSIVAHNYGGGGSARFAANPILDFRNQKSGQSVKLFWILVSRDQQTAYSCLKIQAVETENE